MLLDQRPGIAPHEFQSHKSPPEVQSVRTLRALCIGAMLQGVRASFALMTISLPTRDKPAKADFPRIQKSPLEVMELIKSDEHALTNLFYAESGWAPFSGRGLTARLLFARSISQSRLVFYKRMKAVARKTFQSPISPQP